MRVLSFRYWPHEGVNLHTRDIRKALADFAFLQVPALRGTFLAEMSAMMAGFEFTLFITGVRKRRRSVATRGWLHITCLPTPPDGGPKRNDNGEPG